MSTYSETVALTVLDRITFGLATLVGVVVAADFLVGQNTFAAPGGALEGLLVVVLVWRLNEKLSALLHRQRKAAKSAP